MTEEKIKRINEILKGHEERLNIISPSSSEYKKLVARLKDYEERIKSLEKQEYICIPSRLIVNQYVDGRSKRVRADVTSIEITDTEVIVKARRRNRDANTHPNPIRQ